MSQTGHNLLLTSLTSYYQKKPAYRKLLYDIIQGVSPLSLRVIDWFMTHYARMHNVIYWIDEGNGTMILDMPEQSHSKLRKFYMYLEYRAQLKSYTKLFFDPFRRHERITFVLETNPMVSVETTVGQLNFFRWAMQNHVLDYIMHFLPQIEEDMAQFQKSAKNGEVPRSVTTSNVIKKRETGAMNAVIRGPCHVRFD